MAALLSSTRYTKPMKYSLRSLELAIVAIVVSGAIAVLCGYFLYVLYMVLSLRGDWQMD